MTTEAIGEQHDSSLPAPPLGEAAALVARLLSGCDPHAVTEAAPSSTAPEPTPGASADPSPIPPGEPAAVLTYDRNKSTAQAAPDAVPALPYRKATLWTMIVIFAALVFGAGLAVGYGILNRQSNSKSTVQASAPPPPQSAALAETAAETSDDQPSIPPAPTARLPKPTSNLSQPSPISVTSGDASALAQNRSETAVQARNEESTRPQAITEPAPAPSTSSDSSKPSAATEVGATQNLPTSAQRLNMPTSSPTPDSSTQPAGASAQSSDPKSFAVNAVRSESLLPPITTPAPVTAASDGGASGLANAHTPPSSTAPTQSGAAALGNVDPCQLIHSVQPVYPQRARELHIEGNVELRVVVGTDGVVRSVGLVSGPPLLVMAAMDAAREFRYKPASLNGQPIETVQTIDMSFDLKN